MRTSAAVLSSTSRTNSARRRAVAGACTSFLAATAGMCALRESPAAAEGRPFALGLAIGGLDPHAQVNRLEPAPPRPEPLGQRRKHDIIKLVPLRVHIAERGRDEQRNSFPSSAHASVLPQTHRIGNAVLVSAASGSAYPINSPRKALAWPRRPGLPGGFPARPSPVRAGGPDGASKHPSIAGVPAWNVAPSL